MRRTIEALLSITLLLFSASQVQASIASEVTATVTLIRVIDPGEVSIADGQLIIHNLRAALRLRGTFTGSAESLEDIVLNLLTGTGREEVIINSEGTVEGIGRGTLTLKVVADIAGCTTVGVTVECTSFSGAWVITSATGELQGLHGQGTFQGSSEEVTLSGQIHLET